jgi:hypothetical protein
MKNSTSEKQNLTKRLAGYAAAAGSMLALAPTANGQVVWSGERDSILYLQDTLTLDINNDAQTDFKFLLNGTSSGTQWWSSTSSFHYSWNRYASGYIVSPDSNTYNNSWVQQYSGGPAGLIAGELIDAGRPYWSSTSNSNNNGKLGKGTARYFHTYNTSYFSTSYVGNFVGHDRFVGVRFYIGTEQHYGWVRVNMSTEMDSMNIVDWAYETQPDSGIIAGGIPPVFINEAYYNNDTVQVGLNFPFPVQNLAKSDFIVTNGLVSNLTEIVAGEQYNVEIIAAAEGEVTLTLPIDSVDNSVGLLVLANSTKFIIDTKAPHVTINPDVTTTNAKKISVTLAFDEKITGCISCFTVTNGNASNLHQISDTLFKFDVTAVAGGEVVIQFPANTVNDLAGNGNILGSGSYIYEPTAVENITTDNVMLYPNPASNTLYVKLNSEADISFINSAGETVLVEDHFIGGEINISDLKYGIYIVQIVQNGIVVHKKLIVE